jgi:hopene-associated glycosyltransferase HpnB
VLLSDADIAHDRQNLAELVGQAEAKKLDLVSLMVVLHCATWPERWLIPAFVFFFQMLYPFAWVNAGHRRTAGAAGGCMLVRRAALARIGGVAGIRGALIDDCALAAAIKPGGPIWLGLATRTRSLRVYPKLGDIWLMVARTAYVQLDRSPLLLALTVLGMTLTYVAPPALLLVGGVPALLGALAWLAMAVSYAPTLRRYGPSARGSFDPICARTCTPSTASRARPTTSPTIPIWRPTTRSRGSRAWARCCRGRRPMTRRPRWRCAPAWRRPS